MKLMYFVFSILQMNLMQLNTEIFDIFHEWCNLLFKKPVPVPLSLVHTGETSTSISTNPRHTHAQNQSSTNQAFYGRAYALRLCLCLSH